KPNELLSITFTPLVRLFAIKNGIISYPRSDRWHQHPTALLGGAGIYLAFVISALCLGLINKSSLGLLSGATLLFVVGLLDDKFHFAPYIKLFAQIVAGCIVIFSGIVIDLPLNILLSVLLTLFWIVGVTNAFNLLDNIDGLAAGIAVISSLTLFFSSIFFSNNPLGIIALILSGAALGFLPYNFNPAKIFMGDSGSMFLGYSLAVISIAGTARHISNFLITMLIPVFILSVPIFDTIFVMVVRALQRRRIFKGGKDHTSHCLVTLGLSPRKTVLLLYSMSIAFSLIALLYSRLNIFTILILAFLSFMILMVFGIFLFEGTSYIGKPAVGLQHNNHSQNKTILTSIIWHKRRVLEVLIDLVLICIAYYSAYFLRFEGPSLLNRNLYLMKESLVWIILIKMSVFFIFGLYRGVWRYISISDLLAIFKVVSIGSVASILFLTFAFRFQEYSRAVFFMDWVLLLFLISGSRILFRVLGEFFSRARKRGENVLIFGAGDTGEMVIREIKRNASLNYNPVGFIDDNPSKSGNKIHGIAVLGSRDEIKKIVQMYKIKEVIIASPSIDIKNLSEIVDICKDSRVSYRTVKGILDKEELVEPD
ncbi:MAG: hypothetical protein KKH29_06045, partial [Candidatus Omnitrophica bacterium]|nr:hypothetical protein [Candidatus Omnitrophota bacterium]